MLFAVPIPQDKLEIGDVSRQGLLHRLLDHFRRAFPAIKYSIVPEFGFLNAQAVRLGSMRLVKLYGGLAFDKRLGKDALAYALLHETGHHLAGGPRLPLNPLLACECNADLWAASEGVLHLLDRSGCSVDLTKAVEELGQIVGLKQQATDCQDCWASSWLHRSVSIIAPSKEFKSECALGKLMMQRCR